MKSFIKLFVLLVGLISTIAIISCGGSTVKKGEGNFKKLPNGGEVNGPRSIENIDANIKMLIPRFEYFYSKRLKINPDLQGTIEFILDIDANGNVIYSSIGKSSTNDADFDDEILHAVSLHKFGEWTQGKGETEVIYPFTFTKDKIGPTEKGFSQEEVKQEEEKEAEEEEEKEE